jgi:hypothetical protein
LMLLRLDPVVFGGRFAEVNELPDLPAKLGEIAILVRGKVAVSAHIYIVSRYKWCDPSPLCNAATAPFLFSAVVVRSLPEPHAHETDETEGSAHCDAENKSVDEKWAAVISADTENDR